MLATQTVVNLGGHRRQRPKPYMTFFSSAHLAPP